MPLCKCRACSYWVLPDARACPNCGIHAPTSEASPFECDLDDTVRFLATLLFALAGMAASVVVGFSRATDDLLLLPIWALSGLLVGWLVGDLLGSFLSGAVVRMRDRFFPTHSPECLQAEEQRIRHAIGDLMRREQMIRGVRRQAARYPSAGADPAAGQPHRCARVVSQEAAQLMTRLWEITALRWENQIEWISVDASTLGYAEAGARARALSAACVRMEAVLRNWERSFYANTDAGAACIGRLRALIARRPALVSALLANTFAPIVTARDAQPAPLVAEPDPATEDVILTTQEISMDAPAVAAHNGSLNGSFSGGSNGTCVGPAGVDDADNSAAAPVPPHLLKIQRSRRRLV